MLAGVGVLALVFRHLGYLPNGRGYDQGKMVRVMIKFGFNGFLLGAVVGVIISYLLSGELPSLAVPRDCAFFCIPPVGFYILVSGFVGFWCGAIALLLGAWWGSEKK